MKESYAHEGILIWIGVGLKPTPPHLHTKATLLNALGWVGWGGDPTLVLSLKALPLAMCAPLKDHNTYKRTNHEMARIMYDQMKVETYEKTKN